MIRSWHRLGLVVACAAFVLALVVVAQWLAWYVGIVVGLVGVLLATAIAEDWGSSSEGDEAS